MRHHPDRPEESLIEPADLQGDRWRRLSRKYPVRSFMTVLFWAEHYLCVTNDHLGRRGPICPFVRASLDKGLFFMTSCGRAYVSPADIDRVVLDCRDWFARIEPIEGEDAQFKTILILFPDLPSGAARDVIDASQARMKPAFVERGLMIGQFHRDCLEPGVRNPEFRPLRCPVPMLVIRQMTAFDLPFVTEPGLLRHYLSRFGDHVPDRLQPMLREIEGSRCPFAVVSPGGIVEQGPPSSTISGPLDPFSVSRSQGGQ